MKIVREHINEKFREESDPVHDLGIGIVKNIEKSPEDIIKYDTTFKFEYLSTMNNNWHISDKKI